MGGRKIENLDIVNNTKKNRVNPFIQPTEQSEIIDWYTKPTIEFAFKAIDHHVNFANKSIAKEMDIVSKSIEKHVQTLNLEDEQEEDRLIGSFWDGNEYFQALTVFDDIQWRSEFLIIYSYFEHFLNLLCRIVQKRSKLELSNKDVQGSIMEKSQIYLTKVAGVDCKLFGDVNWKRAKLLAEIRNQITHSNSEIGYTPEDPKSLSAKLEKEPDIKLQPSYRNQDGTVEKVRIELSYEFVKQAVVDLKEVIMKIGNYQLYIEKN